MTCLSIDRVRRYRRQELPEEERRVVELHLSECRSCRRILVDDVRRETGREADPISGDILRQVRNLVPARRRPTPRTWLALAAVLVAVLGGSLLVRWPEPDTVLRDHDEVSNRLVPVEPAASAEVQGLVRFRWTAVPEAKLYRLVILGNEGSRLLERESYEPEIEIDASDIRPLGANGGEPEEAEEEVYWLVEALLAGGDRLTSPPRRLIVAAGSPGRSD